MTVRPTADRVREAWMSIVQHDLPDAARARSLLRLRRARPRSALARRRRTPTFVESSAASLTSLKANIELLGAEDASHRASHRRAALRRHARRACLRRGLRGSALPKRTRGADRRALARGARSRAFWQSSTRPANRCRARATLANTVTPHSLFTAPDRSSRRTVPHPTSSCRSRSTLAASIPSRAATRISCGEVSPSSTS